MRNSTLAVAEEGTGTVNWRTEFRGVLRTKLVSPISFGELYDVMAPLIPEYIASRYWNGRRNARGALGTPYGKRWIYLIHELRYYNLSPRPSRPFRRDMVFRAIPRICDYCGEEYIGESRTRCCSSQHARWQRERVRDSGKYDCGGLGCGFQPCICSLPTSHQQSSSTTAG